MLTRDGCMTRRDRLWKCLPSPPELLLITDLKHVMYLANFAVPSCTFRANDASAALILRADGRSTLVVDHLLIPFAKTAWVDDVVTVKWYDGTASAGDRRMALVKGVAAFLHREHSSQCFRLGIECGATPAGVVAELAEYGKGLENVDLTSALLQVRRRKLPDELALIQESIRAGEAGMAAARSGLRPGHTELDLYQVVCQAATHALGEPAWVYGDFVSGPRCETGGGLPTARRIAAGDVVLLDFSVVVGHYRADFATTFVCDGAPNPTLTLWHKACQEALAAAEARLRPGTPGRDIDARVRAVFRSFGLESRFTSHAGHGIGLGHPEGPFFTTKSTDVLSEDDVVALEPGLYEKGVAGVRIERNYRITAAGYECLTHHSLALAQG